MRSSRIDAYHNLSTLLEGGVPASRALAAAVEGQQTAFADALRLVGNAIRDGVNFDEALRSFGRALPEFDRTVIEVGESTGNLPEAFRLLSRWYGFEGRVRRKVLAGLALPVAVIHVAALVFPISRIVGNEGPVAYLLGVAQVLGVWYLLAAVLWFAFRNDRARGAIDPLLLGIPVLGRALLRLDLSRYCRAFATLYTAGLPASRCARLASELCRNRRVGRLVGGGAAAAERGEAISSGFAPGLPPEFLAIWTTGEDSGTLDEASARLAGRMEEDAEFVITELARWAPRVVYFLVMLQMIVMIFSLFGSIYG